MTDADVERVARGICVELGLNPDHQIGHGAYDDDTPQERAARNSNFVPGVLIYSPRWRLYRWRAAEAIATQAALDR